MDTYMMNTTSKDLRLHDGLVNILTYPDFCSLSISTCALICTNSAYAAAFVGSLGSLWRRSMTLRATSCCPTQQRYRGDSIHVSVCKPRCLLARCLAGRLTRNKGQSKQQTQRAYSCQRQRKTPLESRICRIVCPHRDERDAVSSC